MTLLPDVRSAPSILVVDDTPTVRRMAHRLLTEWGFRVFEAESGEEAIEVLETAKGGVQLVIVDVDSTASRRRPGDPANPGALARSADAVHVRSPG